MVRSIQQLESLREAWDALAAPFQSPLLDHDWFTSSAAAFHRDQDLRILATWDGGTLTGVAPLVRERGRLVVLGGSHLHEPTDWLFSSDQALDELVELALEMGEPMILQRMPVDSSASIALSRLSRRRALSVVRPSADSLAVNTRGRWDSYYAGLSSRITSNLRRLRRKAEKMLGPMTVVQHQPMPSEVDAQLETVMAVEGSGWKGRRGSSLGARPDLRDFFRRYCHLAAAKNRLRVSTLRFGEHVAAVELSVEAYRRMWQLKIGYQESLAPFYPGLHLTEMSIRSSFERGLDAYEFLGSAAAWEERWRPETRGHRLVAVYPVTAPGLVGACQDVAGALWRRLRGPGAAVPEA